MVREHAVRQRAAARDALAARTRRLTGGALTVSALLSGAFAGLAAASAPGKKLHPATTTPTATPVTASTPAPTPARSTAIPPLPAPPGPGNVSAPAPAPAPATTPAPAPAPTPAPPVVVSGGS